MIKLYKHQYHVLKKQQLNDNSYWAWHELALMHYEAINYKQSKKEKNRKSNINKKNKRNKNNMLMLSEDKEDDDDDDHDDDLNDNNDNINNNNNNNLQTQTNIDKHIVNAVNAFFKSIAIYNEAQNALGDDSGMSEATKLQDILRLLHLWFNHGHKHFVSEALLNGFNFVIVDTWLDVIPQIIARLQTAQKDIAALIQKLLIKVGQVHPQALVYALAVASKSMKSGKEIAKNEKLDVIEYVLDKMREHSPSLVEQAFLVSQELIRSAILWDEMWYEALEEASRTYFGNKDPQSMFDHLQPLHSMMIQEEAQTFNEISFDQNYS